MPSMAYDGVLQILAKLKKGLVKSFPNIIFLIMKFVDWFDLNGRRHNINLFK